MLLRPHRLCHLDGVTVFICLPNRLQLLLITNENIGILFIRIVRLIIDHLSQIVTPIQAAGILLCSIAENLLRLQLRHLGGEALGHHIVVVLGILQLLVPGVHHLAQAKGLRHVVPGQNGFQLVLRRQGYQLIVVVEVHGVRVLVIQRSFGALPLRDEGAGESAGQGPGSTFRQGNVIHQPIVLALAVDQHLAILSGEHRTCAKGLRLCISAVHHCIAANGIQLESMINAHRPVLKQCGAGLGLHVLRGVGGDRRLRGRKQLVNFQILRCFLHL